MFQQTGGKLRLAAPRWMMTLDTDHGAILGIEDRTANRHFCNFVALDAEAGQWSLFGIQPPDVVYIPPEAQISATGPKDARVGRYSHTFLSFAESGQRIPPQKMGLGPHRRVLHQYARRNELHRGLNEKEPTGADVLNHATDGITTSKVRVYHAPAGKGSLPISDTFALKVNGKTVDVYEVRVLKPHTWGGDYGPQQYESAAMAYFDFEGPVDVEITVGRSVDSVVVRPLRCRIQPTIRGSTVRFSLTKPGQHSIEINGDITHNLQLFTNPIERDKPQASDSQVRFFGPGVHFPADGGIDGAIQLRSNETIYIAGGAVVHGTIQTPCHEKIHDATIRGRGILMGQRDTVHKRGLAKIGFNCERITIKDIHLIDSYGWVLEVAWATDVLIENIKVIAYRGNSDGIDIVSCKNVMVRDCYIRSADDNLVVINAQYDPTLENFHVGPEGYASHYGKMFKDMDHKGQKRNTSNVTFRNCILWQDRNHPDAIHVGWSMRGREIHDVHFEDIDILHTRGGGKTAQLDIDTSWWGDKGNVIHDVVFENIRMEDARGGNVIHIRQINQPATVRNVLFRNIHLLGGRVHTSSIIVTTPGSRIENITFENMVLRDRRIRSLAEAGISIPEQYCDNIVVK